jgi:hypothetical protein
VRKIRLGGVDVVPFHEQRRPRPGLVMTRGSWPFYPAQCPRCLYFHAEDPAFIDDSGYEVLGFCRHPRVAMELFRPQQRRTADADLCPLFIRETMQGRARPPGAP